MDNPKSAQPAIFSRVNATGRLVDQAHVILRQAIIAWKFKPGDRLRQKELARELGVSQMVIREVLALLEADGLVIRQPYKGTVAAPQSFKDIEDLYHIRLILEGYALELAVAHITEQELAQMRQILPETSYDPVHPEKLANALIKHREFHEIAIRASGNRHLIRTLNQIWNLIDPYLRYSPDLRGIQDPEELALSTRNDLRIHTDLLEALEARDAKNARAINEYHLMDGFETLRKPLTEVIQWYRDHSPE